MAVAMTVAIAQWQRRSAWLDFKGWKIFQKFDNVFEINRCRRSAEAQQTGGVAASVQFRHFQVEHVRQRSRCRWTQCCRMT